MACTSNKELPREIKVNSILDVVRFYDFPDCKMVSSGYFKMDGKEFHRFMNWFDSLPVNIYPQDFLFNDENGFHWLYVYTEGMNVPDEYDIIDFKGGLYAVSCSIDREEMKFLDYIIMNFQKKEFLEKYGYEVDESRPQLMNIFSERKILGYTQADYWTPIKPVNK
jgi:AraC family transcriptional regulator